MNNLRLLSRATAISASIFFLMAANGGGCGGTAGQEYPDVSGQWALTWQNNLDVEIKIGGSVYNESVGAQGGVISIMHNGQPITFDLDCARPEVVCPSEVWATTVGFDQRDENFAQNVYVTIPKSECSGTLVDPDPKECGTDTTNEACDQVCDGEVTQSTAETFGLLNKEGTKLSVLLGGGIATNGVNCALLGLSIANADVDTAGTGEDGDWTGNGLSNGQVVTGFAGGCLWAGDANDDGTVEALVVGASIKLSTNFTGTRQ